MLDKTISKIHPEHLSPRRAPHPLIADVHFLANFGEYSTLYDLLVEEGEDPDDDVGHGVGEDGVPLGTELFGHQLGDVVEPLGLGVDQDTLTDRLRDREGLPIRNG